MYLEIENNAVKKGYSKNQLKAELGSSIPNASFTFDNRRFERLESREVSHNPETHNYVRDGYEEVDGKWYVKYTDQGFTKERLVQVAKQKRALTQQDKVEVASAAAPEDKMFIDTSPQTQDALDKAVKLMDVADPTRNATLEWQGWTETVVDGETVYADKFIVAKAADLEQWGLAIWSQKIQPGFNQLKDDLAKIQDGTLATPKQVKDNLL